MQALEHLLLRGRQIGHHAMQEQRGLIEQPFRRLHALHHDTARHGVQSRVLIRGQLASREHDHRHLAQFRVVAIMPDRAWRVAFSLIGIAGSGGVNNYGISTHNTGYIIGATSGYSGNITLQTDTISLHASTPIQTSGNITVEPYTANMTIGVDGGGDRHRHRRPVPTAAPRPGGCRAPVLRRRPLPLSLLLDPHLGAEEEQAEGVWQRAVIAFV